eukprot:m51a1_g4799 hypothetical protein (773) ;mRNA; f:105175-107493
MDSVAPDEPSRRTALALDLLDEDPRGGARLSESVRELRWALRSSVGSGRGPFLPSLVALWCLLPWRPSLLEADEWSLIHREALRRTVDASAAATRSLCSSFFSRPLRGVAWQLVSGAASMFVDGDFPRGESLLRGAAVCPAALFAVGLFRQLGLFLSRDLVEAEALHSAAAARGHVGARDSLAFLHAARGDRAGAARLWAEAAALGYPRALFNLGACHSRGFGVERDVARALELLRAAVSLGDQNAPELLAWLCPHEVELRTRDALRLLDADARGGSQLDECSRQLRHALVLSTEERGGTRFLPALVAFWSVAQWRPELLRGETSDVFMSAVLREVERAPPEARGRAARFFWESKDDPGRDDSPAWALVEGVHRVVANREAESGVALLERARECPAALFFLGLFREVEGTCVRRDYALADRLLASAAELGHVGALVRLAYLRRKQGLPGAVELWQRAADLGHPVALFHIGACHEAGDQRPRDPARAAQHYRAASDKGYAEATNSLALCFFHGDGVERDVAHAFHLWRAASRSGCAAATTHLGTCYRDGEGVTRDPAEAARLFREAADRGDANALVLLAECYQDGAGVDKDPGRGVRLLREAATLGSADALFHLALSYEDGNGVYPDIYEAVRLYLEAADRGHLDSLVNLAQCYKRGRGVARDLCAAARCYRQAAELGDTEAQYELGKLLRAGAEGVERDCERAARLFEQSAGSGYARARGALGLMRLEGQGVAMDARTARELLASAVLHTRANSAYRRALDTLRAAELQQGQ